MNFRPARAADHEAVLDLCAAAFDPVPRAYFAARQLADPDFHYDDAFVALTGDRPVSHVQVGRRTLRLLDGDAACGFIGDVCTHPQHRGRGHSTELLRLAIAHMAQLGQPLSVLDTGVPGHYARLGWEHIAEPVYTAEVPSVPSGAPLAGPGGYRVRPFAPDDLDSCIAVYEAFNDRRPRTLVRSRAYWQGQLEWLGIAPSGYDLPPDRRTRTLVACAGPSGPVQAYVRYRIPPQPGSLRILEACYGSRAAGRALWPALAAEAIAAGGRPPSISARLPDDHELATLLLAAGGRRDQSPGRMFRVNDLALLWCGLRPRLEARLRGTASPPLRLRVAAPYRWLAPPRGDLPGGGSAVLIWDGARLTVERTAATTGPGPDAALCPFDSTAWLRLLLAGTTAAALAQEHDCPAEVARFLHDAFPAPRRAPISWPADN